MRRSSPRCRDETPEGRSIVVLAKEKYGIRGRDMAPLNAQFIPFSAQTRISGVDVEGSSIRKGAVDAVLAYVDGGASLAPAARGSVAVAAVQNPAVRELQTIAERIAQAGGTPLAVAKDGQLSASFT